NTILGYRPTIPRRGFMDHRHHCAASSESLASERSAHAPAAAKWTCPMHPQILRDGPGSCPICGMALEPMMPTAAAAPNPELRDMSRRFWAGLVIALPVLALEMGGEMLGLRRVLGHQLSNWLQLAFATPVVFWAGWPFFVRAARSLVTRSLNMFTLIAMGTGVAWTYSAIATLWPEIFPTTLRP